MLSDVFRLKILFDIWFLFFILKMFKSYADRRAHRYNFRCKEKFRRFRLV
jgi:hypothetical protein